jgi:hypothetical protein
MLDLDRHSPGAFHRGERPSSDMCESRGMTAFCHA